MSELMDRAIIGMPYDMAMRDELSRRQFYSRAQMILAELEVFRTEVAQARQVPEGFVLVPVEPTDSMLDAGACHVYKPTHRGDCEHVWTAMLAAAQQGAKSHE